MSSSTPYTRKRTLSMSIGLSTRRAKRTRVDGPAPIPFHGVSLSTGPVPTALDMGPPALAPVFSLRRAASHTDFTLEKIITSYPPGSTHHILRDHGISIDFTPSGGSSGSQAMVPLSYSARHTLFFGHGNDVYARNMLAPVADDGAPFCTVDGPLTLLEAGGVDCSGLLAVGTSRGAVQIRDAQTRGMVSTYTVKGATAVAWSGRTLTVATAQGTVRQIDTREPQKKKRGGAGRKTAHEAAITALAWNPGHSLYVTGDADGTVLCWDPRARTALNVEEPIAHAAAISSLTWCPWSPKTFATGDDQGTAHFWSAASSTPTHRGTLALGCQIVGQYFSAEYREVLSVTGPSTTSARPEQRRASRSLTPSAKGNQILAHSFPSLQPIATVGVSDKPICGSTLNTAALDLSTQRVVVAVPDERKLRVFDVWGKEKPVRRKASFESMIRLR